MNLAQNPSVEVNTFGWNSNDPAKYPLTRDTTAPISGTGSAITTRGVNLITAGANGTFEGGVVTGWVTAGSPVPTFAADATRARTGTGSMKISWATGTPSLTAVVAVGMAGLVVGQSYTLDAWLYIPAGATDCSVAVTLIGAGNIVTQRDQWVLSTYTFTATVATHSMQIGPRATTVAGATVYVDDVKLYITPDAVCGSIYSNGSALNNGALNLFPVTPGVPVTWAMDVKSDQAGRRTRMQVGFRDAANGAAGAGPVETYINLTAGVPARIMSTGIPPVNAAFAYGSASVVTLAGNAVAGERCWFDNCYAGSDPTGTYFDGNTPGAMWSGAVNASPSIWLADAVNRAMNPNVEINSLGWNSNDGSKYPVTRDTTAPISGTGSVMATRTATTLNNFAASLYLTGGLSASITAIPVIPGVPITWALDFKTDLAGRRSRIGIWFRDAAQVPVGSAFYPPGFTTPPAGVTARMITTAIPPAGAAFCYIGVDVATVGGENATVGERAWFDNLYIGPDPTGTYFDGSSPGCVWVGTPNQSASFRPRVYPYSQWNGSQAVPLNGAWQTTDAAGALAAANFAEVEVV
jgi:hypothetical protein